MLYIFGGFPGTGKSELASHLAQVLKATYLRVDTIEQALRNSGMTTVGPEGYELAYRLAVDNLKLGIDVVADSVNPLKITRQAWRGVAQGAGVDCREIEVICSDQIEHRSRVESRQSQVPGLRLPTWNDVLQREYHLWDRNPIVIDTAGHTAVESKQLLEQRLAIKQL
ncbi:MAG: AAA family ATPase [Thermosynechococcaceae cyanobacterium]